MMIYLDDTRPTPTGWIGCRWPEEVIKLLESWLEAYEEDSERITHISLDHDLGDTYAARQENRRERTGYQVLLWIEEAVAIGRMSRRQIPTLTVHSSNPAGIKRMEAAIQQILALSERTKTS